VVYTSDYPIISLTVDVVCLARDGDRRRVLMVERGGDPFAGRLAFPGGFVEIDEDLEAAARRELEEETGVSVPGLRQLGAYGEPGRDPRGRTVTVVFVADLDHEPDAVGGSDAAAAGWFDVEGLLGSPDRLAFDHAAILRDATT
jgi:8-oxo-dGTP diphosphatase